MTQTQSIVVYGEPRGKGRPRFAYGSGHAYTDAATTEYEGKVKKAWKSENNFKFSKMPTEVTIKAFFSVPCSLSKKKRAALFGTPCTKKPDADNIAKIILDALNGIAYEDDSQIIRLKVVKTYVMKEEELPRAEVTVTAGEELV